MAGAPLDTLRAWVAEAPRILVLTGAGMSAESGVPTFRDAQTGHWAHLRPEEMASVEGFRARPGLVWDWYAHRRAQLAGVEPNAGHRALADFSRRHPDRLTIATQNVDGLHQRAGSTGVLCLHGDLRTDRWLDPPRLCCNVSQAVPGSPPTCGTCGNRLRPAVVWFGEALPEALLEKAQDAAHACALMLVVGTAGVVYPAAGLAHIAHRAGARVAVVNPAPSALDDVADLVVASTAAQALPHVLAG
ncbi:SIR2 family NAD-dependent protein deacylase [Acidovorax sp. NCPPB 4044]|uniref:SIR2 family NAD-dependent protein deacylase n=1 Tax=Acidovorax sp. NCPPB 4044 TaxID=2940490 RepID=UPI002302296B|nr:NAD-dependent deacylase [Acidovorax sp. NCPPB 4044]MDA8520829.1 NAD-dependent deacylase [Acidovorax sp. NCPPB 4044]